MHFTSSPGSSNKTQVLDGGLFLMLKHGNKTILHINISKTCLHVPWLWEKRNANNTFHMALTSVGKMLCKCFLLAIRNRTKRENSVPNQNSVWHGKWHNVLLLSREWTHITTNTHIFQEYMQLLVLLWIDGSFKEGQEDVFQHLCKVGNQFPWSKNITGQEKQKLLQAVFIGYF